MRRTTADVMRVLFAKREFKPHSPSKAPCSFQFSKSQLFRNDELGAMIGP